MYRRLVSVSVPFFFFNVQNLAPESQGGGKMVTGTLADMIEAQYHSMGALTEKLSAASVGVQGSGWGWLGYDKVNKRLAIATCANQVRVCLCVFLSERKTKRHQSQCLLL